MKVAIIGNYLPRPCGIATFTANLTSSVLTAINKKETKNDVFVVAMDNNTEQHKYPEIVQHIIQQHDRDEYTKAAKFINNSEADICILQHEFGIYGGESGLYILSLLQRLKMPIVITMHTVLQTPSYHEKHIIKKMGELSQKMVVMSRLAIDFLSTIYKIPSKKISLIYHGVPDFTDVQNNDTKFKYNGKKVLSTFGFLGRSKGLETVINALPKIVNKHPNVVYVIMGQTHPNVKRHAGEEYRNYLKNLAKTNHVSEHVIFEDDFFEEEDLKKFLVGLDIYITPYLNEAQITSGTISYALGAGACIVSTPFWYAQELLSGGRGKTFAFGDSNDLANKICYLLNNPQEVINIKKKAFEYGKKMYWDKIGVEYKKMFDEIMINTIIDSDQKHNKKTTELPRFSMDHIKRLTDDFGILEHANYSIPNYKEGYCLDDNSRALLLVLKAYELGIDKNFFLVDTYLRFIKLMQKEDGLFHNDISYDKKFLDDIGSNDSFGRTIWAMGYLIYLAPNDNLLQFAKDIFFRSLPHFIKIESIRAISSIIIGLCYFLKHHPDNEHVIHILNLLTSKVLNQYKNESHSTWKWFEPILCYDNAIIPLALWYAYNFTKREEIYVVANESTSFLDHQTCKNGKISLIGNTWYYKGKARPYQGQQPINAMAMIMMYSKAFKITKEEKYHHKMLISFSWFMGNNDLYIPLFDEESKGCCDGIELDSINRNQGAESTISYLLSYLTIWATELEMESAQGLLNVDRSILNNIIQINKQQMVKVI